MFKSISVFHAFKRLPTNRLFHYSNISTHNCLKISGGAIAPLAPYLVTAVRNTLTLTNKSFRYRESFHLKAVVYFHDL